MREPKGYNTAWYCILKHANQQMFTIFPLLINSEYMYNITIKSITATGKPHPYFEASWNMMKEHINGVKN